jgi:CHAT domain-containing protein
LIKPIEKFLDPSKLLCIIPDKSLNFLPFAALISSDSSRYLVEDYPLLYSPSSSVLLACTDLAKKKNTSLPERLLSIGNPRFSRNDFPELSDLPSATKEAITIGDFYSTSHNLIEKNATESVVRLELPEAEIIHLAAHGVIDENSPMNAKFLLAKPETIKNKSSEADGILTLAEIYKLKLPRTKLVVLSACQTATGVYYKGEGMMNLARPFIAVGVPLIVASLWQIDSGSTAQLMINFHKLRKRGNRYSCDALSDVQREALTQANEQFRHPYYWAGFIALGGYAQF